MSETPVRFDPTRYVEVVLRPLRGRAGDELPPVDERYALDTRWALDRADDDAVLKRVATVVNLWNRQAEANAGSLADVCVWLLEADQGLRGRPDHYTDPDWWRNQIRDRWPGRRPSPRPRLDESPPAPPPVAGPDLEPPTEVTLAPSTDGIVLTWRPARNAPPDVLYSVERLIAGSNRRSVSKPTSKTTLTDAHPPVARTLWYTVRAEVAGAPSVTSDPVSIVYRPGVSVFMVRRVAPGVVEGRWRAHQDTRAVRAWRTEGRASINPDDGVPVTVDGNRFRDEPGADGEYTYNVMPVYWNADTGLEAYGEPVYATVEVSPLPPVPQFTDVVGLDGEGLARVRVEWIRLPAGTTLMIRRFATPPPGGPGDIALADELDRFGEPVAIMPDQDRATFAVPPGRSFLVPVASAGGLAVRGETSRVEVVPAVTGLEAQRHGDVVFVSWRWPDGVRLAHLAWTIGGKVSQREVSRSEYLRLGGVEFRQPDDTTATVTSLVPDGAKPLLSNPSLVDVARQPLTLTFHVTRPRFVLCGRSVKRRILVHADRPCTVLRITFRLHVPHDGLADDLELITIEKSVPLGPDNGYPVDVELPRRHRDDPPGYIRCTAHDDAGEVVVDHLASTRTEVR